MGSNGRGSAIRTPRTGRGAANGVDLFDRPSTADTGGRNAFDLYETPRWMTASLLHHHRIAKDALILEPCAGGGAIARALEEAGHRFIVTNDLDQRQPTDLHGDAADFDLWANPELAAVDWVITNPPYDRAFQILMQAERLARVGVAMVLRKTFMEPTEKRGPWFAVHPPTQRHRRAAAQLPRPRLRQLRVGLVHLGREPDRSLPPFVIDHNAKARRIA
jgi:hypothetical protein